MRKKVIMTCLRMDKALKRKVQFISSIEDRSASGQMDRFIKEGVNQWEKAHGRIPPEIPS